MLDENDVQSALTLTVVTTSTVAKWLATSGVLHGEYMYTMKQWLRRGPEGWEPIEERVVFFDVIQTINRVYRSLLDQGHPEFARDLWEQKNCGPGFDNAQELVEELRKML